MVNRKCLGEVDSDPVTRGGLRLIPARAAATARGSVLLVQLAVTKKKNEHNKSRHPPSEARLIAGALCLHAASAAAAEKLL